MLRSADDPGVTLSALAIMLRSVLGDHEQADLLAIDLCTWAEAVADDGLLAVAHLVRGIEQLARGDGAGARSCFSDALAMADGTGDATLQELCAIAVGATTGLPVVREIPSVPALTTPGEEIHNVRTTLRAAPALDQGEQR